MSWLNPLSPVWLEINRLISMPDHPQQQQLLAGVKRRLEDHPRPSQSSITGRGRRHLSSPMTGLGSPGTLTWLARTLTILYHILEAYEVLAKPT